MAIARRRGPSGEAEDRVQEALLLALEAGRCDLTQTEDRRWLTGVVRNRARMAARAARRRQLREAAWQARRSEAAAPATPPRAELLSGLSPALRAVAALALTGHDRREIAHLLRLPDTALRQRVTALKRQLRAKEHAVPRELTGLHLELAYGRLRDALLPAVLRHGGHFATHDPDGHLFIVRRSQRAAPRQQGSDHSEEGSR